VNWCSELGTVLANEEVIDGKSEVVASRHPQPMRQWMLASCFAERLLTDLDTIDWSDSLKKCTELDWPQRSAEVDFKIGNDNRFDICKLPFYDTSDTLFGATYMVLSPEHKLLD